MFGIFIIVFGIVGLAACAWGMVCNSRTFDQRMDILRTDYRRFKRATYQQHYSALFWGKDPKKLYE